MKELSRDSAPSFPPKASSNENPPPVPLLCEEVLAARVCELPALLVGPAPNASSNESACAGDAAGWTGAATGGKVGMAGA